MNWDTLFEEYMQAWCEANADKLTAEEMEEKALDLYEEWTNAPCDELDGLSPKAYFNNVQSVDELISMMDKDVKNGSSPCSLLLDRLSELDCEQALSNLLISDALPEVKIIAVNLLRETDANPPLAAYLSILADENADEGLVEVCVEALCDSANAVKDSLFEQISNYSDGRKVVALDILMNADKDERTYHLLVELFQKNENRSLIAGYMGKYGDERAAMVLYPALDECPYVEYIEIRNAIEQLGGVVDDEYRDFSSDPTYKALKNVK